MAKMCVTIVTTVIDVTQATATVIFLKLPPLPPPEQQ